LAALALVKLKPP